MNPSPLRARAAVAPLWLIAVWTFGCGEATYSPTDCPRLPRYSSAEARRFDAGVGVTDEAEYPWLSPTERAALREAARRGCVTLAQRHYSLPPGDAATAVTAPGPDAAVAAAPDAVVPEAGDAAQATAPAP